MRTLNHCPLRPSTNSPSTLRYSACIVPQDPYTRSIQFAVCAFRAEVDGKVIEGKIKEKQKARETYDDAIAQGHGTCSRSIIAYLLSTGAYLLEEKDNQPSVFSASVGNLPAGKAVLLTITYVTELDFEDGKLKCVPSLLHPSCIMLTALQGMCCPLSPTHQTAAIPRPSSRIPSRKST